MRSNTKLNCGIRAFLIPFVMIFITFKSNSQTFTEMTGIALTGVYYSSTSWGDYDKDGDLDLLIQGNMTSQNNTRLYRNNGNSTFTNMSAISLTGLSVGDINWVDADNDGDLDIFEVGSYSNQFSINNGNSTFTEKTNLNFEGISGKSIWNDFDNDGDLDLLMVGYNPNEISKIYRNDGNLSFTDITGLNLANVSAGKIASADYDNDGDLDFFMTGNSSMGDISRLYRNDGNLTFSLVTSVNFLGVYYSTCAWGDYDNDGNQDIFVSGYHGNTGFSKIYKNNGNNTFTELTAAGIINVYGGSAAWGDYDNDGDLDLLMTGHTVSKCYTKLYRYDGSNVFTDMTSINFTGLYNGSVSSADYDNDGDLDVVITGLDSNLVPTSKIYRNNCITSNTAPSQPSNLQSSVSNQKVTLKWNKSSDTQTPQTGLSYNIYVYKQSKGLYEATPMSDTSNGWRRIANIGPIRWNSSGYLLNITDGDGGTFKWSVQAIDGGLKAGDFAPEASFSVCVPPFISTEPLSDTVCESYNINFGIVATGTGKTFQWQLNSGSGFSNLSNNSVYSGVTTQTISITSASTSLNGYKYRCIVSGSCTPKDTSAEAILTVLALPKISSHPSNASICYGSNTNFTISATGAGISYQWQENSGSGFNDISSNSIYTGTSTKTLTLTSVPATMNGYTYRCVVSGTCSPPAYSNTVTLTVNSAPSVTNDPTSVTICEGKNSTYSVGASGAGLSYQWQANAGNGFGDLSNNAIYSNVKTSVISITAATASMNNYLYRCVVSGTCSPPASSNAASLTVNILPVINTQPANSSICSGGNTSFAVSASGSGISFKWQENKGSGYNDLTNSSVYSGVSTATISLSGVSSSMNSYLYRCIISGTCTPDATSNAATLLVYTPPSISSHPSNSSICTGSNTTFAVAATGTSLTYKWQVDQGSGFIDLGNSVIYSNTDQATLIINGASSSMNGLKYRCIISGTCSPPATSNSATLTVNTAPALTSHPSNSTICAGSNTSFSVSASGTNLTYQWQVNSGSGFSDLGVTSIYSNVTSATLNVSGATAGMNNYLYRCVVSGSCSPPAASNSAILSVNTSPSITYNPSNSTICDGSSTTFSVSASGSNLTYQWQVDPGTGFSNLSNASPYSGVTTSTLTLTGVSTSMNSYTYRCVVTGSCTPTATSNSAVLVVNTSPSISYNPINSSICAGGNTSFSVTASGSNLTYQWQVNSGSGFSNISNTGVYSGATTSTLNITGASTTYNSYQYRCVIYGSCSPSVTSNTAIITVNSAASIATHPSNNTICSGNSVAFYVGALGSVPFNYQWYGPSGLITGANLSSYSISNVNLTQSGSYFCVVTNVCNSTGIQSNSGVLTVNLPPSISAYSQNASRCENQSMTFSITAIGTAPLSYQWYSSNDTILNATNNSYTINSVSHADSNYYYCIVSNSCGTAKSSQITLTIDSKPSIISQTDSTTSCAGSNTLFYVNASGKQPITYQWYFNGSPIGGSTNSFYLIPYISLLNSGNYYASVSNNCGNTVTKNINLSVQSPLSILFDSRDSAKCENSETSFRVDVSGTGPIYYQWYYDTMAIPGAISNTYIIDSVIVTDAGKYFCKITNPCGTIKSLDKYLTVYNNPVVRFGNDTTFCLGGNLMLNPGSNYFCKWSNGSLNSALNVIKSGLYWVDVKDIHGCEARSDSIKVKVYEPYIGEIICLVTVDKTSGKNLIAWERTKGKRIAYYNIYKESTVSGFYNKIGSSPFDSLSVFIDFSSSPKVKSDRYKISVVDSCGNESELSPHHKTIHLTANQGVGETVNLIWSHYEGFTFYTYKIYRGNSPTKMKLIDSIQNNLNSYTDLNPPKGKLFYQVSAVKLDTCHPELIRTEKPRGPFSQSYSNLKDYNLELIDYLEIAPLSINIDSMYGSEGYFDIFTNSDDWKATTLSDWIDVYSDYENNFIRIKALHPNHFAYSRQAVVTVEVPGLPYIDLDIFQLGTNGNTSVSENCLADQLKIYPNPSEKYIAIELPDDLLTCHEIEIFDQFGRLIYSENCENQKALIINTEQLSKGVYLVRVKGEKNYFGRFVRI